MTSLNTSFMLGDLGLFVPMPEAQAGSPAQRDAAAARPLFAHQRDAAPFGYRAAHCLLAGRARLRS
jgi:hypothetical protein